METGPQTPLLRIRHLAAAFLAATALLLAGCGQSIFSGAPDPALRVLATTTMLADLVREIGGTRIAIEGLMGPGVDPHSYKASQGDIRKLAQADLVIYHGLHLEAKLADVLGTLPDGRAVAVAERLPAELLLEDEDNPGLHDPHVWFDIALWEKCAEIVAAVCTERDPEGASTYTRNLKAYQSRLAQLDGFVRAEIAKIPAEQRVLVTAHDAFRYFGRAYGVEVRGLQGISTAAEAGAQDLQQLAQFIADRRIPAIFVESSVPHRSIEAVRQAVAARGHEVRVGAELYSDALGSSCSGAGDYLSMMQMNASSIRVSLVPADAGNSQ